MTVRLSGATCIIHDCKRPAREIGGYCTTCWRGLTASEREGARWYAERMASGAAYNLAELEAAYALPPAPDGPRDLG